jgi:perosamine synthetase
LDIGPGDDVIMPSYTCVAVMNAVVQVGASPILADSRYDVPSMDYNVSAETLAAARTTRTRAVIVPHMFGTAASVGPIKDLGLPVIEDITLSLGATHRARPVGSFGDISVCSFHASKMMACGEGGMLASKDRDLLTKARYLNGWADEQAAMRLSDRIEPYRLRYNFRMSDLGAALGRSQLRKLSTFISRRQALADQYSVRLSSLPGVQVPNAADGSVFFRYLVAVPQNTVVERIRRYAECGIEAGRGVYPGLHRSLAKPAGEYPGAEMAMATLISVPLYPALNDDQVEHILRVSEKVLPERSAATR